MMSEYSSSEFVERDIKRDRDAKTPEPVKGRLAKKFF